MDKKEHEEMQRNREKARCYNPIFKDPHLELQEEIDKLKARVKKLEGKK